MDEDDDMILIIVGDENEDKTFPMPTSIPIKEEIKEELDLCDYSELDPKSILESAELHGEYISLAQAENFDCEYLEVDYDKIQKCEVKIKQDGKKKTGQRSQHDSDHDDHPKVRKKSGQSYIAQLRKNFPKMQKDEDYLVAHLCDVMKNIKPPTPPTDFCHSVNEKLVCSYCDRESATLPIACRHYQKKHGSRYLNCYACGTSFRCTTGLYKHEKRCVAPGARLVLKARGRYLGRKGRRRPYLTLNKFQPFDSKPQPKEGRLYCSQCTASFKHKDALESHEYMHRGIRPYQCHQCPAAYTSNIALRRHIMRHTNVQFTCDTCGRSFNTKTTLVIHMHTHLPQRRFPCDRCDRRFAQKNALQHHINREHLNIPPPYACAVCPKRYPRISNLKQHMKAKHGLSLMSRQMFFKTLPTLKETELKQATVVFNNLDNNVIAAPLGNTTLPMFVGNPKCVDDNISIKSNDGNSTIPEDKDEDEDIQTVENDSQPLDRQVVSEIVPFKYAKEATDEIEEHVKNRHEEILGTTNDEVFAENEKEIGTPKKAVVQTSLQEGCELEFVKFISKISDPKTDKKKSVSKIPRIDLSILQMHKNIQKHTGQGRDMPVLKTDDIITNKKEVMDPKSKNEMSKTTKANKSATEMIDDKRVNEVLTKIKASLTKRDPVQTRSGVMKTRSGAVIKSVVKEKRNVLVRKNR